VAYVSSVEILKETGLLARELAWLHVGLCCGEAFEEEERKNGIARSVLVVVDVSLQGGGGAETNAGRGSGQEDSALYVNALTAINLGCYGCDGKIRADVTVKLEPLPSTCTIEDAEDVTLCVVGLPEELDKEKNAWPFPGTGAYLQVGTLVAAQKQTDAGDQGSFYYEIVQVNNSPAGRQQESICRTSPKTRYRFVLSEWVSSLVPQLPPLSSTYPPHPDVDKFVSSFKMMLCVGTTTLPAERIVHVVGSERDHHCIEAIRIAARQLGRQPIIVEGLAATAYLLKGDITSSGQLYDKLTGLEAALELAHKHAPSVLVVPDLDQELSRHDDPLRRSEESRIWALLMDKLSSYEWERQSRLPLQVPAVLVIYTTRTDLKPGPLLENLSFASLAATPPDVSYIHHLWYHHPSKKDCRILDSTKRNVLELCSANTVVRLMRGRSARDIIGLREVLVVEIDTRSSETDSKRAEFVEKTLQRLCEECDEKQRLKAGLGRIPTIKWEDVGGLAHVRREILDTIELPLKHPHLFSNGSKGRTGILLYGPPGSGQFKFVFFKTFFSYLLTRLPK
jgi:hypothetical protein